MKTTADQMPIEGERPGATSRARSRQGWLFAILAVAVAGVAVGFRFLRQTPAAKLPVETFIPATAPTAGMIQQISVSTGQHVRKGELLAVMEYSQLQAHVDEAQQNVFAALNSLPTGPAATALSAPVPGMTGNFEKKAVPAARPAQLPPLPSSSPKTLDLKKPATAPSSLLTLPTTPQASATAATAAPEAKVKDLTDQVNVQQDQIGDLQKKIAVQKDSADAAQALVTTVAQVAARSKADSDKSASLLAEGVISANEASKSQSYSMQAQGQLQAAKVRAAEAEAMLGESQRALDTANQDLQKKQADLAKAQADLEEAKKHPAARPSAPTSQPKLPTPTPELPPQYKLVKMNGPIANSPPPTPVQVNFFSPVDAVANVQKAEAALAEAQKQFASACVYAPSDGVVIRVLVRPGQLVRAGYQAFLIRQ